MRLPASLRGALYATGGLVAASGSLWLVVHDASRRLAVACIEVHGTTAMALLVLVGAAAALHAPTGWRERRNRASGAILSTALIVLMATGALLYYLGDEGARSVTSVAHWTAGLAAVALGGVHVWLGRRGPRAD
jgi:hypothetical protein